MSSRSFASRFESGSSSSMSGGSQTSARASASRCCCPPESCGRLAVREVVELHRRQRPLHPLAELARGGRRLRGSTSSGNATFL